MEQVFLPETDMLPRVIMAREYDTRRFNINGRTPKRIAKSYEMSIFTEDGGIMLLNGTEYAAKTGDVRFNHPGDEISSLPHYKSVTVYFHLGAEGVQYSNDILDALPCFFHTNSRELPLFRQIAAYSASAQPGSRAVQNALMLELIVEYYHLLHGISSCRDSVRLCIEYMQQHMSEHITLKQLGELTGYSPLHIMRIFREDTQQSPHEYLSGLRMSYARRLLADTSIPVSELAAECGFSSESYFFTSFRKLNGITPGEYRAAARLL